MVSAWAAPRRPLSPSSPVCWGLLREIDGTHIYRWAISGFPEIWLPPNHPFTDGFSIINQQFGLPPCMETLIFHWKQLVFSIGAPVTSVAARRFSAKSSPVRGVHQIHGKKRRLNLISKLVCNISIKIIYIYTYIYCIYINISTVYIYSTYIYCVYI